jgi:hypothetical protein
LLVKWIFSQENLTNYRKIGQKSVNMVKDLHDIKGVCFF